MSMVEKMATLKQAMAIAREQALVQHQAFSAHHLYYAHAKPPQTAFPGFRPSAQHTTGEVVPGQLRQNGQPMTKSGQVCKKFLAAGCTYIHDHPNTRAPATAVDTAAEANPPTK